MYALVCVAGFSAGIEEKALSFFRFWTNNEERIYITRPN